MQVSELSALVSGCPFYRANSWMGCRPSNCYDFLTSLMGLYLLRSQLYTSGSSSLRLRCDLECFSMNCRIYFISRFVWELAPGVASSPSVRTRTFLNFLVEMLRPMAELEGSLGEWAAITSFMMSSTSHSILERPPSLRQVWLSLEMLLWLVLDLASSGLSSSHFSRQSRWKACVEILFSLLGGDLGDVFCWREGKMGGGCLWSERGRWTYWVQSALTGVAIPMSFLRLLEKIRAFLGGSWLELINITRAGLPMRDRLGGGVKAVMGCGQAGIRCKAFLTLLLRWESEVGRSANRGLGINFNDILCDCRWYCTLADLGSSPQHLNQPYQKPTIRPSNPPFCAAKALQGSHLSPPLQKRN